MIVAAGEVFDVAYPFVRERIDAPWQPETETGMRSDTAGVWPVPRIDTWKPGTRIEDDGIGDADGMGAMLLTVVSVHVLPGRYHPRVFYVRQWRDPDGKIFGKGHLRIIGAAAFTAMSRGYRHPFELDTSEIRA